MSQGGESVATEIILVMQISKCVRQKVTTAGALPRCKGYDVQREMPERPWEEESDMQVYCTVLSELISVPQSNVLSFRKEGRRPSVGS